MVSYLGQGGHEGRGGGEESEGEGGLHDVRGSAEERRREEHTRGVSGVPGRVSQLQGRAVLNRMVT